MSSNATVQRAIASTYTYDGDRGINFANIENAKTKFQDYITVINNAFEEFKNSITKYDASFFGEQAGAIKTYVNSVMDASAAILAQLNDFAPALDEAVESYKAQDSSLAGSLTGTGQ